MHARRRQHKPNLSPPPLPLPPQEKLVGGNLISAPVQVAGSSLKFANYFYPTAESLGGVRVVCACGDTIRGRPLLGGGSSSGSGEENDNYGYTLSYASVGSGDEGSGYGRAGSGGKSYTRYDQLLAFNSYKASVAAGSCGCVLVSSQPCCVVLLHPAAAHPACPSSDLC